MNKTTRTIALFLSAILTATSAFSCSKEDDTKVSGNGGSVEKVETDDGFKVPEGIAEGKTFSMYIANPDIKNSFIAEEETGDDLNDAVFQRNALVEAPPVQSLILSHPSEQVTVRISKPKLIRSVHGFRQAIQHMTHISMFSIQVCPLLSKKECS